MRLLEKSAMKSWITFLLFCPLIGFSQISYFTEAQVGGSNFLGATVNSGMHISLDTAGEHQIRLGAGLGALLPSWDAPTMILSASAGYERNQMGIGCEASGFTDMPFVNAQEFRSFVDLIVYPNVSYTFHLPSAIYLRCSAGAYFAFDRSLNQLQFAGDVIPGAGVAIGRKFTKSPLLNKRDS